MSELVLSNVKKSYDGKQVVHGVSLTMPEGHLVVLVGPSGCGKSTLLRMIAGLEDINEGTITIGGHIVNDLEPAERGCAMVFQNYALYPHMTVRENIGYPLKLARVPVKERDAKIREAAAILNLSDYLDRRPAQLSGGQRQRVAMGRAIVRQPRVFLFDEPLSNLDALLRVQMRIEIKRLHKRLGTTSVFVTHDQVEAMTLADTLIVMNAGHIEQIGAPTDIYRKPASVFVAGFLGAPAMNLLDGHCDSAGRIILKDQGGASIGRIDGIAPDTPLIIGVRPEAVRLSQTGSGALKAEVEMVEELGGARIAHCHVGATSLAVMLPAGTTNYENRAVALQFDASDLHLFDKVNGRRIDCRVTPSSQRAEIYA